MSSIDVRYDDDPATTFTEPWPGDEVVVLPDDGSLPTAAPDEAAARARHVGRRLRLEGDDDQADWAAVSRCYVSYVEGFEGVLLGVERDGVRPLHPEHISIVVQGMSHVSRCRVAARARARAEASRPSRSADPGPGHIAAR